MWWNYHGAHFDALQREIDEAVLLDLFDTSDRGGRDAEHLRDQTVALALLLFTARELNDRATGIPNLGERGSGKRERLEVNRRLLALWHASAPRELFPTMPMSGLTDPDRSPVVLRNLAAGRLPWGAQLRFLDDLIQTERYPDALTLTDLVRAISSTVRDTAVPDAAVRPLVLGLLSGTANSVTEAAAFGLRRVKPDTEALVAVEEALPEASERTLAHMVKWLAGASDGQARKLLRKVLLNPSDDARGRAAEALMKHPTDDELRAMALLANDVRSKTGLRVAASVPPATVAEEVRVRLDALRAGTLDATEALLVGAAADRDPAVAAAFAERVETLLRSPPDELEEQEDASPRGRDGEMAATLRQLALPPRLTDGLWDGVDRVIDSLYGDEAVEAALTLAAGKPDDPRAHSLLLKFLGHEFDEWGWEARQEDAAEGAVSAAAMNPLFRTRLLEFMAADRMSEHARAGLWAAVARKLVDEQSQGILGRLLLGAADGGGRKREYAAAHALHALSKVSWCASLGLSMADMVAKGGDLAGHARQAFHSRQPESLEPMPRRFKDKMRVLDEWRVAKARKRTQSKSATAADAPERDAQEDVLLRDVRKLALRALERDRAGLESVAAEAITRCLLSPRGHDRGWDRLERRASRIMDTVLVGTPSLFGDDRSLTGYVSVRQVVGTVLRREMLDRMLNGVFRHVPVEEDTEQVCARLGVDPGRASEWLPSSKPFATALSEIDGAVLAPLLKRDLRSFLVREPGPHGFLLFDPEHSHDDFYRAIERSVTEEAVDAGDGVSLRIRHSVIGASDDTHRFHNLVGKARDGTGAVVGYIEAFAIRQRRKGTPDGVLLDTADCLVKVLSDIAGRLIASHSPVSDLLDRGPLVHLLHWEVRADRRGAGLGGRILAAFLGHVRKTVTGAATISVDLSPLQYKHHFNAAAPVALEQAEMRDAARLRELWATLAPHGALGPGAASLLLDPVRKPSRDEIAEEAEEAISWDIAQTLGDVSAGAAVSGRHPFGIG